jgi:hypothetical protein
MPYFCSWPVRRGFDTAEPAVQAHPADAFLVAGQAQPDIVGPVLPRLAGKLRDRRSAPHDAHQIGVTFARIRSAWIGSLTRPTPITGSRTALRMAEG